VHKRAANRGVINQAGKEERERATQS
jgi:hypothetical protein